MRRTFEEKEWSDYARKREGERNLRKRREREGSTAWLKGEVPSVRWKYWQERKDAGEACE